MRVGNASNVLLLFFSIEMDLWTCQHNKIWEFRKGDMMIFAPISSYFCCENEFQNELKKQPKHISIQLLLLQSAKEWNNDFFSNGAADNFAIKYQMHAILKCVKIFIFYTLFFFKTIVILNSTIFHSLRVRQYLHRALIFRSVLTLTSLLLIQSRKMRIICSTNQIFKTKTNM